MSFMSNIVIDIYSIVILSIIYFHVVNHNDRIFLQHRLYRYLLQGTMLTLVADILSRFDGNPDTVFTLINHFGNFAIYLLNPMLPSLFLLYAYYQVVKDEVKTKVLIYPLGILNGLNLILLIFTQHYGWYYFIDSNNIYHRGPYFFVAFLFSIGLLFASIFLIIKNRENIDRRYFLSLLVFAFPPLLCMVLQVAFYGISLMLSGVVLSLLIIFFNIQNYSMNTDYLTGVYNRKKLENYMREKINSSTSLSTFSTILIDLDDFKQINDTLGHDIGDNALESAAKLIKSCVSSADFVSRFGGDEFCVILDDSNLGDVELIVSRIKRSLEDFNENSEKPYKLGFSMGYDVYEHEKKMNVCEFQKHIDELMYQDKRRKKKNN